MNLPTTSNIWTISFICGLLLILLSLTMLFEIRRLWFDQNINLAFHLKTLDEEQNTLKSFINNQDSGVNILKETLDKQKKLKSFLEQKHISMSVLDSINTLRNDIEKLEDDFLEIDKSFKEKRIALKELKNKLELSDKKIYQLKKQIESYEEFQLAYLFLLTIGIVLSIIGYNKLSKNQSIRDSISASEYLNLRIKHLNCQSCYMNLEDDLLFDKQSNYCSFCYSDGNFNHNISLKEFKLLLKKQLKKKNYNWVQIQFRLMKLNDLARWRKKFDWK